MNPDYQRSVAISINCDHLRHNLCVVRRLCKRSKVLATIKADAYGHGAVEIAQALSSSVNEQERADGFAVVTVAEALQLRDAGIRQPIMVLQGPQSPEQCQPMAAAQLWPVIHDAHQLQWYQQQPESQQLSAWLKVDTGMGRLGFALSEVPGLLEKSNGIPWMGVMSHLAYADNTNNEHTRQQIDKFTTLTRECRVQHDTLVYSLANSAAVLAWPDTKQDWARPGIMLFGCNPLDVPLASGIDLKPVMTVTAPLISVKHMPAGAGIGYAQIWHCPEDMPIGYLAMGYRDGLPRLLDESACVSVNGHRCPVVGRVSMDSIAIDLRSASQNGPVLPGVMVEVWGNNANIDLLAEAAGTISYELLTGVRGQRMYPSDEQHDIQRAGHHGKC